MIKSKDLDVVVIGNVGIDTNVYLDGDDIDFNVETNFTENIDYVGQAGGFASRGYARLGRRTAFIGHVGDDVNGRWIREEFAHDKIDTTGLMIDPAGTSRSINFMYKDGRRKNFYDGKSHMQLQPDLEMCASILSRTRLAHFNIPNWARQLLPIARRLEVTIACDIQDVVSLNDDYRQDFIDFAHLLFFSAVNQPDPSSWILKLLRRNPRQVVVAGMGSQGCAVGMMGGVEFFSPAPVDIPIIDTNGAGDSLAAGFLNSFVLKGYSLTDSVLQGQIAARRACSLKASSADLITGKQMRTYCQRVNKASREPIRVVTT